MKCYKNITTDEVVYEDEAESYVLSELGIAIIGKGKNGEKTLEQQEFIDSTVEWFFSGNWVENEVTETEYEPDIFDIQQDIAYQDYIDKEMGL